MFINVILIQGFFILSKPLTLTQDILALYEPLTLEISSLLWASSICNLIEAEEGSRNIRYVILFQELGQYSVQPVRVIATPKPSSINGNDKFTVTVLIGQIALKESEMITKHYKKVLANILKITHNILVHIWCCGSRGTALTDWRTFLVCGFLICFASGVNLVGGGVDGREGTRRGGGARSSLIPLSYLSFSDVESV